MQFQRLSYFCFRSEIAGLITFGLMWQVTLIRQSAACQMSGNLKYKNFLF